MKLNKLVAAFSAAAMLGSLAVAVPASAKTVTETDKEFTATSAFQVRGTSAEMTTKQAVAAKGAADAIEMTYADTTDKKAWFGAVYSFDIPDGVTVTSATLSVPRSDTYKGVAFTAVPLTADQTLTADNVFNYVAAANITSAAVTATLNNTDNDSPLSGDVTSLFNGATLPNAIFVYKANQNDKNARKVMGTATLTLSYTYEEPDAPVAQIGETKYASFTEAYTAAKDGDEIVLLADVTADARFKLEKAITISGNGQTITGNADILITKNVTIDGVNVTTASQAKFDVKDITVTVKNATVTGGIYLGKENGTLVLEDASVDKVTTRNGADAKATVTKNAVTADKSSIGELVYYSATDVLGSGVTATTMTDTYAAPTPVAPTGSFEKIYSSDGKDVTGEASAFTFTVTANDASGKVVLSVDGATVANSDTEITGGSAIFGIRVNKDVEASIFSATLGGAAIVIE